MLYILPTLLESGPTFVYEIMSFIFTFKLAVDLSERRTVTKSLFNNSTETQVLSRCNLSSASTVSFRNFLPSDLRYSSAVFWTAVLFTIFIRDCACVPSDEASSTTNELSRSLPIIKVAFFKL